MKNILISFFLFFIMIFGILFSLNAMDKVYSELETLNRRLEQSIKEDNWEKSILVINEISDKWQKHSNQLSIFLNHAELDNINSELAKLSQYVIHKNKEESMSSLHVIKFFFKHTLDIEKISLGNIF